MCLTCYRDCKTQRRCPGCTCRPDLLVPVPNFYDQSRWFEHQFEMLMFQEEIWFHNPLDALDVPDMPVSHYMCDIECELMIEKHTSKECVLVAPTVTGRCGCPNTTTRCEHGTTCPVCFLTYFGTHACRTPDDRFLRLITRACPNIALKDVPLDIDMPSYVTYIDKMIRLYSDLMLAQPWSPATAAHLRAARAAGKIYSYRMFRGHLSQLYLKYLRTRCIVRVYQEQKRQINELGCIMQNSSHIFDRVLRELGINA